MNNLQSNLLLALLLCLSFSLQGQIVDTITDADLEAGQDYVWTANTTYVLDGLVYLEANSSLTIEPGTIIRGKEVPSDEAQPFSALIIARNAILSAKGEICNPIVFTGEQDDFVNLQAGGQWGGLILLGQAPVHTNGDGVTLELFGLSRGDNVATFGGTVPEDNSGVLSYVSIRYAGDILGESPYPGLTLAGVGNGTQIDHVEVFTGAGPGIAVRGGVVNTKFLASVFNAEEAYLFTRGYQGLGQFHFSHALPSPAGVASQLNGADPNDPPGTTRPLIYNATYLGAGQDNTDNIQASTSALFFTQASAGEYVNSVFADFSGFGLFIQDIGDGGADSYEQLLNDNLQLKSNLWAEFNSFSGNPSFSSLIAEDPGGDQGIQPIINHLTEEGNTTLGSLEGLISGLSRIPNNQLDPRPTSLSPPFQTSEPTLDDSFFDVAPYRGAFNEDMWLKGWTALDLYKYLPECDLEVNANTTDIQCFGETGSINLEILGNVTDLAIDWDVDAFDGQAQIEDVQVGVYNVTVTNAECCEQQLEIIINGPSEALVVDCTNTQDVSNPGESDGSITLTTAGGGAPETVLLTRPDGTQETRSFADGSSLLIPGLEAGEYNAAVTDSFGCTADCDFIIGAPPCFIIQDDDLVAGGNYTWTADNCYIIDGLVFLESTGSLTIEPGTVIEGRPNPTTGQNTSALIIAKGANINAQGTEANPIIFTAETADDVSPDDLTADDKGLWGGLAILGDAEIPNPDNDGGERFWEVLDEITGAGQYGGFSTQNVIRNLSYVSIRHAGAAILPNQVFPALTFAAVRETAQLDHLEVFAAADRGIAFYGGTAQLAYASATFCEGPAFSWQDGYNGKGQFWFALSDPGSTDLIADHRGYINSATQDTVVSAPQIFNATYIGGGGTGNTTAVAMRFRESSAGVYGNSIFTHFNGNALEVEDIAGDNNDSQSLMEAEEDFFLRNNLFWGFGAGDEVSVQGGFLSASTGAGDPDADFLVDHLAKYRNKAVNPKLISISNVPNQELDPRPEECAAFFTRTVFPDSVFFDTAVYFKGAFGREEGIWLDSWTSLAQKGYLEDTPVTLATNTCTIQLDSGQVFLSEFIPEATPEYIEEVRGMHEEYAEVVRECNCDGDSISRLILWETTKPTDITNCRSGAKDSTIIDTSGLFAMFDLGFEIVQDPPSEQYCGTTLPEIDLPEDSVIIGILDSGVDLEHDQLSNYVWENIGEVDGEAGVDNDENCIVDDINGYSFLDTTSIFEDKDDHGTHLAGIVTGNYPTNLRPQIMNLKIYEKGKPGPNGEEPPSRGSVFDLICAIHYAINEGAQVINLSIGYWSPELSIPLYNALKKAQDRGILIVVSSGNDGDNVDERRLVESTQVNNASVVVYEDRWPIKYKIYGDIDPDFPNLSQLIGVSSVEMAPDSSYDFPSYANYGISTVDLSTKGIYYSTVPENKFKIFQGTSMSTAAVSRLLSMARAYDSAISAQDILNCVRNGQGLDNTLSQTRSGVPLNRLLEDQLLNCLGVTRITRGVIDKPLPSGVSIQPTTNSPVCDEPLIVTFGDGDLFFQKITVIIKESDGQGGSQEIHRVECSGSVVVWNTLLADGTELDGGSYFLEFWVNGERVGSQGLQQFLKCDP